MWYYIFIIFDRNLHPFINLNLKTTIKKQQQRQQQRKTKKIHIKKIKQHKKTLQWQENDKKKIRQQYDKKRLRYDKKQHDTTWKKYN